MTLESENEEVQPQDNDLSPPQDERKPAITISVQSWATPIIGVLLLIAGLFGGYYGRPLLSPDNPSVAVERSQTTNTGSSPVVTVPTPDADLAAQQQELMTAVVEGTRHFRGDPNAPVTIIEFSDFQ